MQLNHNLHLYDDQGNVVSCVTQAKYVGALLTVTGSARPSMTHIGAARRCFLNLCAIWTHANVAKHRKVSIYFACVVSKLMYFLETECLWQADLKSTGAFHYTCLRKICKIPHSMISHVSNAIVLETAGCIKLSVLVHQRQFLFFGRMCLMPNNHVVRQTVLQPGTIAPTLLARRRRRGRPRLNWSTSMYTWVFDLFDGNPDVAMTFFRTKSIHEWKQLVRTNLQWVRLRRPIWFHCMQRHVSWCTV